MKRTQLLFSFLALSALALALVLVPGSSGAADPPGLVSSAILEGEGGPSICATGCGGAVVPASNVDFEQAVIDRVNAERAALGRPPLKLSNALRNAARYHAADMVQDDYYAHDTYDRVEGSQVWVCDVWTRVRSYYPSPTAENIAAGFDTPESVMQGWLGSGGHRDTLLDTAHRETGVGYYPGASWGHYWVQDFGSRSDVYPLVINREAATTDSIHVSLYQYGSWDEIRLRNDGGSWTDWRPFANTLSWTLADRAGERTVQAEMRGGAETATSSDTIVLTTYNYTEWLYLPLLTNK